MLRLVEQGQGAVQIALGLLGLRAIATRQRYGFCGSPTCSPSSRLRSRCAVGGGQIVTLASDLTHAHVHVRRSPELGAGPLRGELQGLLKGALAHRADGPA